MAEPIPDLLAHLPRQGGLPVPFTTSKRDGRYDFRVPDIHQHTLAMRFQLCSICGKHIEKPPYVFQVGPVCLEARGVFTPPTHYQCGVAALTMCPFLSRENWGRADEVRAGNIPAVDREELQKLAPKPPRVGLAFAPSYRPVRNPENGMYYAFLPPAEFPVEWWTYVDGKLQREALQVPVPA